MFGIFWTALNLTVGVSSAFAHKVEMFLGKRRSILFIIVLLSLGYFLSGVFITFWGIAFLFLFYLVRGVATPVLKNYINQYTASEIRATMLSVRNFVIRITFAVIGPLLGWITDNISLNYAFMLAGGMYLISVLLIVFPWIRRE
jgi:MFS family permease